MFARTAVIALTLSALASQVAAAPAAPSDVDLRCMLVASALSQNKEPAAKGLSNIMVFYYLGRLDARSPGVPLGPALQSGFGWSTGDLTDAWRQRLADLAGVPESTRG